VQRLKAFTLVELLVVIGIIAVLVGILLPALGAARRQAASVKCAAQLREIGNCFKMYELENKGYWPPARINGYGPNYPSGPYTAYNIDGVNYQSTTQAYWYSFLAKYATKNKVGTAVGTNANDALLSRQTIFFGCPSWDGYRAGGVTAGDTNHVQPGFGMNPYPTFTDRYPTATVYPPTTERAIVAPYDPALGRFLKAKTWSRSSERMLVADSRFWLAQSGRPPAAGPYPPAVTAQPILQNSSAGYGNDSVQSLIDMYRHGKAPGIQGGNYDPRGGKISYNVLYCDGHVSTANDGREAYRAIRMKFPG
jgi:prepilin-type N-terminal cleavage/methylation domain-containing protein/prepilin-type processing-associated H-X9-DG protein